MPEILTMPDGSFFEFLHSPGDPEQDPAEMVFTVLPGGPAPPPHVHPRQREVFTLEQGDFELLVAGEWRALVPGEPLAVEPGTTHTFRNRGSQTARVRTVHEPGLTFEDYIRDLHMMVTRHGARTTPALAARMALLWRRYEDTIRPGPLPLRVAFGVLARVGPLLGLRAPRA